MQDLKPILNIAFYRFVNLTQLPDWRARLRYLCMAHDLKGTILLSHEGINGSLAGLASQVKSCITEFNTLQELKNLNYKYSWSKIIPFKKLAIKIKKEIISMGQTQVDPRSLTGARLNPKELRTWYDQNKDFYLLDTRNTYEIECGTFKNAQNLKIKNFRSFPKHLKMLPPDIKNKPVVMVCTGGIRCEKATAFALSEGFKEVYQLEGGILKYFEDCGTAYYNGKCFVFDERETVSPEEFTSKQTSS